MERKTFLKTALLVGVLSASLKRLTAAPLKVKGYILKKGRNRFNEKTLLYGNSPIDIKVSGKDTNGQLSITEYTGHEKGGPPLHIHPLQDEVFYVLEGEHLFQLGTEQHLLGPGDSIFIPRGTPHAPCQTGPYCKMLFFFSPAGNMEDFFRTLAVTKGIPQPAEAKKLFEAQGMKIVGPPLKF
ncbi:cupin domain-containing protein [Mucilaginibacter terrae]|uniref:cupin domain-containing protein n=1 Tax=Mucilaginibacter terrae TaxID=1955052 RepID=UPI00362C024D